jgi:hypothetical protein
MVAACAVNAAEIVSPENSKGFRKYVEPSTGVVSYILDEAFPGYNHQSLYFTQKSMTDDGRFLVFNISGSKLKNHKHLAVYDFKLDKAFRISSSGRIPYLDVATSKLYYINERGVCCHDLVKSPEKAELITPLPEELKKLGKVMWYCTHPTLTRDRKKMFLDIRVNTKLFVQGLLDLETGKFDKWGETDFYINHGQIHPFRDDLALCAWEGLNGRTINGVYQRLWLLEPGGKKQMIPPVINNYATHEYWTEDGKGFYYCSRGVHYHDLETGKQRTLVPMPAAHATITADNSYASFDCSVGTWYRGCAWSVGFYNMKTQKGFYFYPELAAYNTKEEQSKLHPDPHPQFVCRDKYIISTVNLGSGKMSLSITPVDQLIERTSK